MRGRRLTVALLWLALTFGGSGGAPAQEAPPDTVMTTPGWVDPDEPSLEQQELEAAEALLGGDDLAQLTEDLPRTPVAERRSARLAAESAAPDVRPGWRCSWRVGPLGAAGGTASWRLIGAHGPVRILVRRRWTAAATATCSGGIVFACQGASLVAGDFGCAHGLGLLASSPGRGTAPAAAVSFAPAASGTRVHSVGESAGSLRGVAVTFAARRWHLAGAEGALATGGAGDAACPRLRLVRLARSFRGGELSLLLGRMVSEAGGSLAAAGRSGTAWYAVETALWRDSVSGLRASAWGAAAGMRRCGWVLEAEAAAALAGLGFPLGRLPACVPGWDGRGWAVRGGGPLGHGVRLLAMLAWGEERETVDADGAATRGRHRWELAVEARPWAAWSLELRLRRAAWSRAGWEERSPWLPAALLDGESRTQLLATAAGPLGEWRLHLAGRVMASAPVGGVGEGVGGACRGLVEGRLERTVSRTWCVRFAWAGAWGDPLDLVSGAAPAPGLVVPRHWGAWGAERSAGFARHGRHWSVGAGISLRQPTDLGRREVVEMWQHGTFAW